MWKHHDKRMEAEIARFINILQNYILYGNDSHEIEIPDSDISKLFGGAINPSYQKNILTHAINRIVPSYTISMRTPEYPRSHQVYNVIIRKVNSSLQNNEN
jgi:hypothetical protein